MSDRRKRAGVTNKMVAYIAAGLVHLAIIGAIVFNYTVKRDTIEAFDAEKIDTINASVIDDRKLQEDIKEIKEKDRKKAEQKAKKEREERERLEKLKRDAEKEEQRIEDLKQKQQDEKKKAQELESERKAIALKKKKEIEAEKKRKEKEEQEKKKREAAERERKKKADEQRKKDAAAAEEKRLEDADKQRLADMLAAEEEAKKQQQADRRAGERTATVMSKYSALIEAAIKAKWRISPGTESWREAKVNIKLSPRGEVLSVRIVKSSGLTSFDRSAETAILQASPLPFPSQEEDPTAHQQLQDINLNLKQ